jgi:hypothetical protein
MSLESIGSNHMKEKFDEDLKDQQKVEIIGTYQTITSKEALVNLMSQHVMKIFTYHDYTISKSLDYRSNKFVTS